MKTISRQMWLVLIVVLVCQARSSLAQNNVYLDPKPGPTILIGEEAKPQEQSNCNECNSCQGCCENQCPNCHGQNCNCSNCNGCFPLTCSDCPLISIAGSFGFDAFHGNSDALTNTNFGAVAGVNGGMPLVKGDQCGIGWQLGMSYGVYDFDGSYNEKLATSNPTSQQQIFITTGFFHKAQCQQRLSYGIVYDWMMNDQWGDYAIAPTLSQWRGQIEYALSNCNAIGFYGALRDRWAQSSYTGRLAYTFYDRSISHADIFWHHKFACGADSRIWFGVPEHLTYNHDGSLLDWMIGASIESPLSDSLSLYAGVQYAHPTASAGRTASMQETYDISAGVVWYIGGRTCKCSINGGCYQPYLPVANNSTFLVEQYVTATAQTP